MTEETKQQAQQVQPRKRGFLKLPKLPVVAVEVELIYTAVFQAYSKVIQLCVCVCIYAYIYIYIYILTYAYILFQILFHYRLL